MFTPESTPTHLSPTPSLIGAQARVASGTPAAELALALPPWQYQYRHLHCDNARAVRHSNGPMFGSPVVHVYASQ